MNISLGKLVPLICIGFIYLYYTHYYDSFIYILRIILAFICVFLYIIVAWWLVWMLVLRHLSFMKELCNS